MKTVRVTFSYKDMQLGRNVDIGEILEVDDARAEQLINVQTNIGKGVAVIIDEPIPAPTVDLDPPLKTPIGVEANEVNQLNEETPIEEPKETKTKAKSKTGVKRTRLKK